MRWEQCERLQELPSNLFGRRSPAAHPCLGRPSAKWDSYFTRSANEDVEDGAGGCSPAEW
jgi:hypothetical protein